MFAKRFITLSLILRKINKCVPYKNIDKRFYRNTPSADFNPFPTVSDDSHLLEELKYSKIPTKVYCLLDNNKNNLKAPHIVTAVKSLIFIAKRYKNDVQYKNDIFKRISQIIHSNLDRLQIESAVKILEILMKAEETTDVESIDLLLNYITVNIDSLKIEDYSKVARSIVKMIPTKKTKILLEALKLNFSKKFLLEYDANDQKFLTSAFLFASRNINDENVLKQIIEPLSTQNIQFKLSDALIAFVNSLLLNDIPGVLNIFNAAKNCISENLDELQSGQIIFIFLKLAPVVRLKDEFYDKDFVDKLVQKIILEDLGFDCGSSALKCLNIMRHLHKGLLNYLSAKFYEIKVISKKTIAYEINKLTPLISGLALHNHKPVFWNELGSPLSDIKVLDQNIKTLSIIAFHLACLDSYNPNILEKIFSNKFKLEEDTFLMWTFCKLWQKLKTLKNYDGPLPTSGQLEALKTLLDLPIESPAAEVLQKCLGGPEYIKSKVWTRLYHRIDHVIAFDNNGNPIPINNTDSSSENGPTFIENLDVPENSQILLFINAPEHWFPRNGDQLLGTYSIIIDTLKELNHKVININITRFLELPESEQISIINNKIDIALNSDKEEENKMRPKLYNLAS